MLSTPGRIDTLKTEMQSRTGVIISKAMKAGVNVDLIDDYRDIMQYLQSTEWYDEDGKLKTEVAEALTTATELENKMVDTSEDLEKSAKILEQWKSSFDYLTNANERLNSIQRERNEIEREFEKIARDYTTDTADVINLTK
jgi:predicted  nucleic acid-binding Zn-ribbon protein